MSESSQEEIISFLSSQANLPGGGAVEVIPTHAAVVFLSGTDAYKIKRDVRYDYLDFSTLQKRRQALQRELELNAPTAPSIYRDVVAVTRDNRGQLQFGGQGPVVEWVLRMQRFDSANELDKVAERGALDDAMAQALGEVIARYHADALPRMDHAGSDLIIAILDQLNAAFATMSGDLDTADVERFRRLSGRVFDSVAATLDARGKAGHVRRCHGDLHLRNIVLIDGVPTPFDALEFNETLATCDVFYDLAFLLMDLRHKGLPGTANLVFNSYLFHAGSREHYAGLSLLPLFQSVRAAIRAMVAVQAARLNADEKSRLSEARDYLSSALAYLEPEPARLIAIGGYSGTGKTVLARSLAHALGPAPGAVHLRSDLERKALFAVSPTSRLPQSAYDSRTSSRVYGIMRDKARAALSCGYSVILDATWLDVDERARLSGFAENANAQFIGLWLVADAAVLQQRVSARRADASDADAAVVRKQVEQQRVDLPASWQKIDASGSPDDTWLQALGRVCQSGECSEKDRSQER